MNKKNVRTMTVEVDSCTLDEFAVQVSEWIWQHGQGLLNLEIEAKIGLLIDRKTNARLQLPIHCETSTCLMP